MATSKFNNTWLILLWLAIFVWLVVSKVDISTMSFLAPMILALGWFFLIPLFQQIGIDSKAVVWFQKAGLFALLGATFAMLKYVGFIQFMGNWYVIIGDLGILLSWLFAIIGITIGFLKWK